MKKIIVGNFIHCYRVYDNGPGNASSRVETMVKLSEIKNMYFHNDYPETTIFHVYKDDFYITDLPMKDLVAAINKNINRLIIKPNNSQGCEQNDDITRDKLRSPGLPTD